MRARIQRIYPKGRIIAISDVHGHLPYLTGLLDMLKPRHDDSLIFIGDMCEKGLHSLATLRYIMQLRQKCHVYPILGNCDEWTYELDNPRPASDRYLGAYISGLASYAGGWGLLAQMCDELGLDRSPGFDFEKTRRALLEKFRDELDFLRAAPHVIFSEKANFVHGGLPFGEPRSWDAWDCMKNDYYYLQGRSFEDWLIVGHTPSVLYSEPHACANPIIDTERKIATIDGGCVLCADGQLNALIIDEDRGFSFVAYDSFPKKRVLNAQAASDSFCFVRWGDDRICVLEHGREFSRCRHLRSGYELDILTSEIFTEADGTTRCRECSDYSLPLLPGDTVSVVRSTSRGYLVKKDGITGWYSGGLAEL